MAYVSSVVTTDGNSYDIKSKKTAAVPFAQVDSTSTSTDFTATVPEITELYDGVCVYLRNQVVSSASGFTININNLGAKPVYSSLAAASRATTIFNVNYTMLFIYNSSRVEGGCWDCFYGYDSNTNTIGYQIRTNSMSLPMKSLTYRYRLLFTSGDGKGWVPATNSTSTNATAARTVCQDPIDPFGAIVYYGTTASVAAGSRPSTSYLWHQYGFSLGYSFQKSPNYELTSWKPIYLKCALQSDGSAIIDSTTPFVQDLPSSEDNKIYIFLGVAYSETSMELTYYHPVYCYKDGQIRLYTNTFVPTKTSDLTNDSGYITDAGVTSFNGSTGAVTYTAPVTSVNGSTGAVTLSIPSKTSDLTNDSGYITDAGVTSVNGNTGAVTLSIPSKTSDLTNDSGYITASSVPTEVYWATDGTTTSAEIETAYQAGKEVLCCYSDKVYRLTNRVSATDHIFTCTQFSATYIIRCTSNSWSSQINYYEPAITTATGILKRDNGQVVSASAGVDYVEPGDLVDYVKTVNGQPVERTTHDLVQRFNNIFINTEYPSVATTDDYPIIPSSNSGLEITAGTPEAAPHGIKIVANSSARPYLTWLCQNVFKNGYTYTWSFDAEWCLLSDYSGSNTYTFDTRICYNPPGGAYIQDKESFATIQPGVVQTARVTRTFTVTTELQYITQLRIMPSFSDAGPCRANTDYIKISNLMLEEGSAATDWCPSRYITTPAWLCDDTYTKSEVYTKNEVLSRIRNVLASTPANSVTCTLINCTGTLASLGTFNFFRDTLNKMVVVSGRIRITNFARTGDSPGVIINDVDFGTRSSSLDVRGGIVCNQNGIIATEMVNVSISASGTMYIRCTETYMNISGTIMTMIIPQAIIAY